MMPDMSKNILLIIKPRGKQKPKKKSELNKTIKTVIFEQIEYNE